MMAFSTATALVVLPAASEAIKVALHSEGFLDICILLASCRRPKWDRVTVRWLLGRHIAANDGCSTPVLQEDLWAIGVGCAQRGGGHIRLRTLLRSGSSCNIDRGWTRWKTSVIRRRTSVSSS